MEYFRTGDVIKQAWGKFKKHMFFLWTLLAIFIVVSGVFSALDKTLEDQAFLSLVITLVSIVVTIVLELGLIRMYLDLVDSDREDSLKVLWSQGKRFWSYLGASILLGVGVLIGLILLIVPGIYIALTYQFFSYLIVDKELGALEALKRSGEITKGVKWQLLGFSLALLALNLVGALLLLVGLLVTIPVSALAYVIVYRALAQRLEPAVIPAIAPAPVVPGVTTAH